MFLITYLPIHNNIESNVHIVRVVLIQHSQHDATQKLRETSGIEAEVKTFKSKLTLPGCNDLDKENFHHWNSQNDFRREHV